MPKVILPDDGAPADETEHDAPAGVRVEITTPLASIVLDGEAATAEGAYWLWRRVALAVRELTPEPSLPPLMHANAAGFQIEQASEELNTHLPGGWVA